jgi:fructose-1-phosphate kinase PfkB-like protein
MAVAAEQGLGLHESARLATAVASATVTTQGTKPPQLDLVNELLQQVQLRELR